MSDANIKTLIVGCGNIAGGFDVDRKDLPLTHIGAYKRHGKFDVNVCVEPNKKTREDFQKYWQVKYSYSSMKELVNLGLRFDVISICSSTSHHYLNVLDAIKLKPKLIFCEKPIASNYSEAIKIKDACEHASIKLAVNHSRRWDSKVIKLKNEINLGKLGEIRSVIGFYNKGILNNGSHMIDMLLYLFDSLNVIATSSAVNDFYKNDPSISALLKTNSGLPIHLVAANASDYALFEIEIIGSKKTLSMRDGGLNWSSRNIVDSSRFRGYKHLANNQYTKGCYDETMINAVDNIYNSIKHNHDLLCTGNEACRAHKVCDDILKVAHLNN